MSWFGSKMSLLSLRNKRRDEVNRPKIKKQVLETKQMSLHLVAKSFEASRQGQ